MFSDKNRHLQGDIPPKKARTYRPEPDKDSQRTYEEIVTFKDVWASRGESVCIQKVFCSISHIPGGHRDPNGNSSSVNGQLEISLL